VGGLIAGVTAYKVLERLTTPRKAEPKQETKQRDIPRLGQNKSIPLEEEEENLKDLQD
jgi:hypothetical protein